MNAPLRMPSLVLGFALACGCQQSAVPCDTSADCEGGEICFEALCHRACTYDRDCDDGQSCQHGVCLAVTATTPRDGDQRDAAVLDHTATDSRTPDASAPDATGPDAGRPDANRSDANRSDANRPDTSAPDASAPDTSQPDTYRPDTNVSDTSQPDTAGPEPVCGNGDLEPGEACDDDNTLDGDECSADCLTACEGGRTYGLHCYRLLIGPITWLGGWERCLRLGNMDMVAIYDQDEMDFVVGLQSDLATGRELWLGLCELYAEGDWVWSTGEPAVYVNWERGEPVGDGRIDCALLAAGGGLWSSATHRDPASVLCESVDPTDGGVTIDGGATDSAADASTISVLCGNGALDPGEDCDDNNTVDGDECSADCRLDCAGGRTFALHCYRLGPAGTWIAGQSYCQDQGMIYATISSLAEGYFISDYRDEVMPGVRAWIGLNDRAAEDSWEWTSGEPLSFTHWGPREPNDSDNAEDCVMLHEDNSMWNDQGCGFSINPVCEEAP